MFLDYSLLSDGKLNKTALWNVRHFSYHDFFVQTPLVTVAGRNLSEKEVCGVPFDALNATRFLELGKE